MGVDARLERAKALYERAVFGGDVGGLEVADRELNGLEADLALARGRVAHARFLDGQGEDAEEMALFERAVLERSHELATRAGDKLTLSYVLRHLGIAEHVAGRLQAARERLEESVRLRREIGFPAGVAANLVGLAYIAVAEGRRDDAVAVLDEAGELAGASGAAGVLRTIEEARAQL
ncbi:hypothetical protein [Nonomuraea sp. B19D2]|uniref:hypothetical protein n=1 Tax=Nonomuraea sp. B19D2 TaxID=3159561 RepID=UPI0032DB341A